MATDLTTIFGSEIKVYAHPRIVHRQYSGFPGADGLTAMFLGSRGFPLVISGVVREASRPLCEAAVSSIADYLWAAAADYSFYGTTYEAVVFERIQLVPDSEGKALHLNSLGQVFCQFVCHARSLL